MSRFLALFFLIIIMIKEIMKKIIEKEYEAYIVGGFVRDYLSNIENYDIDIITNASKEIMLKIFPNAKPSINYESVHIDLPPYNIDITRYRVESGLKNGKPVYISYIDDFIKDSDRRDFTINSIYLDSDYNLVDPFNYKKDLDNKIIRVIGNTKKKLDEDPLRILRAIRLHIIYDYKLNADILSYIKKYPYKLKEIEPNKRRKELSKIKSSGNIEKFVKFVKTYELDEYLKIN